VEDVLGVRPALDPAGDVLEAERVVAPEDRRALRARLLDSGPKRRRVHAFLHDPAPDADRTDELPEIEEHHVAVALLEGPEVVAMLLPVPEEHPGLAPQVAQLLFRVAVGDVALVRLRPLEIRHEEDVEAVRG